MHQQLHVHAPQIISSPSVKQMEAERASRRPVFGTCLEIIFPILRVGFVQGFQVYMWLCICNDDGLPAISKQSVSMIQNKRRICLKLACNGTLQVLLRRVLRACTV